MGSEEVMEGFSWSSGDLVIKKQRIWFLDFLFGFVSLRSWSEWIKKKYIEKYGRMGKNKSKQSHYCTLL